MTLEEVWEKILNDACHCYADEVGNRPCDYGFPCSICEEKWVQELFESKLDEEGGSNEPLFCAHAQRGASGPSAPNFHYTTCSAICQEKFSYIYNKYFFPKRY